MKRLARLLAPLASVILLAPLGTHASGLVPESSGQHEVYAFVNGLEVPIQVGSVVADGVYVPGLGSLEDPGTCYFPHEIAVGTHHSEEDEGISIEVEAVVSGDSCDAIVTGIGPSGSPPSPPAGSTQGLPPPAPSSCDLGSNCDDPTHRTTDWDVMIDCARYKNCEPPTITGAPDWRKFKGWAAAEAHYTYNYYIGSDEVLAAMKFWRNRHEEVCCGHDPAWYCLHGFSGDLPADECRVEWAPYGPNHVNIKTVGWRIHRDHNMSAKFWAEPSDWGKVCRWWPEGHPPGWQFICDGDQSHA